MLDSRLNSSWWALRLTYGLVPVVAGLDKFTNLLTHWTDYLNPRIPQLLGVAPGALLHVVGVVEIAAGILVLSRLTRAGAYVVAAWLVLIAFNLFSTGRFFDVAVRDVAMAVGALVLAQLSAVKADVGARVSQPAGLQTAHTPG